MDIVPSCSRVARPSHGLHTVLDCVLRQDELIACRVLDRISSRNLFGMRKAHQRRRELLARLKPKGEVPHPCGAVRCLRRLGSLPGINSDPMIERTANSEIGEA